MSRYTEHSFSKKAKRNSKNAKALLKSGARLATAAYLLSKSKSSSHSKNNSQNGDVSIPGCLIALIIFVVGFILAFTISDCFESGLITVIICTAIAVYAFYIVSKISSNNEVVSTSPRDIITEQNEPETMQYNPTQIGDDKNRFALIQKGKRTLFVIGLNPSSADSSTPDPTMQSVLRIASYNGFDGYIMLNLYPLRAT